jgi:hypothetical protein
MELELKEFESRLVVRPLTLNDYENLVTLEKKCFPGMETWHREHLASQLAHFPEGQICIDVDGELVASASSLVVESDDYENWHSWK